MDTKSERPLGDVIDGYTYLREDDVAYAKITSCFENGKAALIRGTRGGIAFGTTEFTVLRPIPKVSIPEYLFRVISAEPFRRLGEASMYGAGGQKRVPDDFARDFSIAWPPVAEQRTIAAFLDHETARIDALIEEQQRLIELLKEKRQAVISHAVTKGLDPDVPMKDSGVEWLGGVPAHWGVTQLKYIVSSNSTITYGIVQAGPEYEGGVSYIKTSDMAGSSLPLSGYSKTSPEIDASYARSKVSGGDVVVAIRATVGTCHIVPEEIAGANLTQGTAKVSPGCGVYSEFMLYALKSVSSQEYFEALSKGATFKEITLDALRRMPLAIPSLDEQSLIVNRLRYGVDRLEALMVEAVRGIELLRERRSALISAAVTGKIDVRDWQAPGSEAESPHHTASELPA